MGILDRMRHKKSVPAPSATEEKPGRTLAEDIPVAADWVANALNSSGYRADYTLESMKELDRFFDQQSGPGGILSRNRGQILFGLGAYAAAGRPTTTTRRVRSPSRWNWKTAPGYGRWSGA